MLDQNKNKKEEVKEENTKNTKNVEEKKTKKKTNETEEKTEEKETKKHKVGVRTPIYKKMNLSILGIGNKAANEAVMKLNNTDKKILQGAIIDSSYCKVYRKVISSLYDEKYKDDIMSLFSNKNIKCLLGDNESSLALASKLKNEVDRIKTEEVNGKEEAIIKEEEIKEEDIIKEEEIKEEVKNKEKVDNKVKEEVVIKEEVKKDNIEKTETDHSNYDDSWKNYEPKGGSRFLSSLGLKIAFIKNAIITH